MPARSAAISSAAPRKKAKAPAAIRVVPHRHQLLHPRGLLTRQQRHRIGPVRRRLPGGQLLTRDLGPRDPTLALPLLDGRVRHHLLRGRPGHALPDDFLLPGEVAAEHVAEQGRAPRAGSTRRGLRGNRATRHVVLAHAAQRTPRGPARRPIAAYARTMGGRSGGRRILVTALPTNDLGLLARGLPVAVELRERGHEVVFASPAAAPRRVVDEAGFRNEVPRHALYALIDVDPSVGGLLRFLLARGPARPAGGRCRSCARW